MPASHIGQDAPRQAASFNRRSRRPWWKRLLRTLGMGGGADYRRVEPFRPDVAIALSEEALRREEERRLGLLARKSGGEGPAPAE